MIDIEKYSFLKYYIFGSLYFTEGLFMAVAFVIIPVYFVEEGIAVPIIGLVILIASIPIILKFIWGAISDYYSHLGRKRFILLGGLLFSGGTLSLAIINPGTMLPLYTLLLIICVIGLGFLDVSADAWAINICTNEEFGKVNGAMFAGQYAGMAIGATTFGVIAEYYSYPSVFLTAGILLFIIILPALLVKETIVTTQRQHVSKKLLIEFKKPQTQLISIYAFFGMVNRGMLMFVIPVFMKISLELTIAQIGLIVALFPITSGIGSLIGGTIADQINRRTAIYLFVTISLILSASLIFATTWELLAILYATIGLLQGCYMAAKGALFMDNTNPKIGATQFSIYMGIGNGGMALGESLGSMLIPLVGFTGTFLYSAWFFSPGLLILYFIKTKKTKKKRD